MAANKPCPHCRSGPETFHYYGVYEYDVDRARQLVADGREPVEIDEDSVRDSMIGCRIHDEHLEHVDMKYPGIIAHVWLEEPTTRERLQGHVLIDGNHRAARALRDGSPFFAYILGEAESREILR